METDTMSSMHFLDQGQLLPSRKPRLYDLLEMAVPQEAEDPIHRTVDLWHGIAVAERFLGFSLKDLELMFRYCRHATIWHLFLIGQHYRAWSLDDPRIRAGTHSVVLSPEIRDALKPTGAGLRELLHRAKEAAKQSSKARGEAAVSP